jgi:hypothetical protein
MTRQINTMLTRTASAFKRVKFRRQREFKVKGLGHFVSWRNSRLSLLR